MWRITMNKFEALKASVCIYRLVQDTEFQCLDFSEVPFEVLWDAIGGRQRNQIRHTFKFHGLFTEERRAVMGEFEDMADPVGVSFSEKWQNYRPAVKFKGKSIHGACTTDMFQAYMVYDCILWQLGIEDRIFNFPSLFSEDKWLRIGEEQRERIAKSLKKAGIKGGKCL